MEPQREKVIPQPDFNIPLNDVVEKTGPIKGHPYVTFVAGEGYKPSDIMFIAPCISPQEASKFIKGRFEEGVKVQPRYLRSDAGIMLKDIFSSEGINIDNCYYTAIIKWLLPKQGRIKIPKDAIAWAMPSLEKEIEQVKPKIIVCIGKAVFDLFSDIKLSLNDARSGWFFNKKFNCNLYLIDDTYKLVSDPEFIEKFRVEAKEINRTLLDLTSHNVNKVEKEYEVINNKHQLMDLVNRWQTECRRVISVDCEWAGNNHIDGKLRSTQFCWAPGKAAYIRWMDDQGNYVFDISYKDAGKILSSWLDNPEVKYIGHHFAADAPWLHHVLGLNWYEKCIFDSEFAQQTADESADLSLERLALKYTDLGRYDLDLTIWVKNNKAKMVDGGYGAIPDQILIPYALADVDVVFRAWPAITRNLEAQGLMSYYKDIFHPFVTDVFVSFALVGLPMDVPMMDELRVLYSFARNHMATLLQEDIRKEAESLVLNAFINKYDPEESVEKFQEFSSLVALGRTDEAWTLFKECSKTPVDVPELKHLYDHFLESPVFNLRSSLQMKRWLFQVKKYTPVKSTGNKEKGLPSISWEKVIAMPKQAQANYTPAVDKQTLQILAEQQNDRLLRKLLQLNAVGNICKAFLKEAEFDDDGNLVKENGLHYFLCSDGRVHGQMSTTETGEILTPLQAEKFVENLSNCWKGGIDLPISSEACAT